MKYLLLILLLSSCKTVHMNMNDCSCIMSKQDDCKMNTKLSPLQEAARKAAIKTNEYFKNRKL